MRKKVTVGIICRNEEKTIGDTLKSVLRNNYPDFEIIVVDGNSTDRTREIARRIASKTKREIRIIKEKPPYCHGNARNTVLDNAKGEYALFIDAGGVCGKNWIKTLVEGLEKERKKDSEIIGGGGIKTTGKAGTWKQKIIKAAFYDNPLGSGGGTGHHPPRKRQFFSVTNCNAIYVLEEIKKFRYLNIGFGEDYELNQRISRAGKKLAFIPEAKVTYEIENSFREFLKKMFNYGKGQATVWKAGGKPRWYAWASAAALVTGIALFAWSLVSELGRTAAAIALAGYIGATACSPAIRKKPAAAILQMAEHAAYGTGYIVGMAKGGRDWTRNNSLTLNGHKNQ